MNEHNNSAITKEEIGMLINCALDRLYENDIYLVNNKPFLRKKNGNHHVGERSIVFRLAHYMQNIMDSIPVFENYVLDCEYNRNGEQAKVLPSFPNGVYPDIIIHNRGNNDNNLLIMEVKSYWNTDDTQDKKKIREFLDAGGDYCFSFGLSLIIKECLEDVQIELLSANNSNAEDEL